MTNNENYVNLPLAKAKKSHKVLCSCSTAHLFLANSVLTQTITAELKKTILSRFLGSFLTTPPVETAARKEQRAVISIHKANRYSFLEGGGTKWKRKREAKLFATLPDNRSIGQGCTVVRIVTLYCISCKQRYTDFKVVMLKWPFLFWCHRTRNEWLVHTLWGPTWWF